MLRRHASAARLAHNPIVDVRRDQKLILSDLPPNVEFHRAKRVRVPRRALRNGNVCVACRPARTGGDGVGIVVEMGVVREGVAVDLRPAATVGHHVAINQKRIFVVGIDPVGSRAHVGVLRLDVLA